jgi:hypothetical protein
VSTATVTGVDSLDFTREDFSRPETVRRAFLVLAEHARLSVAARTQLAQQVASAALESAGREGQILGVLSRLERQGQLTHAAIEGVAARVARLEHGAAPSDAELDAVKKQVARVAARNAEIDKREAVRAAKIETRVDAIERSLAEAREDLSQTGERYVADIIARARSVEAEVKVKEAALAAAKDEEAKEGREAKRYWARWVAGIVGAIALAVVSAWAGSRRTKPAPLPAIAAPANSTR